MRRGLRFGSLVLLLALVGHPATALEVFVSPAGRDEAPGTFDQPFATLARAQRAARTRAGQEAVVVHLRGGTYYLEAPLRFTSADSGTPTHPVRYAAWREETPVLSGGVRLDLRWERSVDSVWKATVPAGTTTDQLFVNGERQILARYPNFVATERIFNGYDPEAFGPARVRRWANPRGGFIHAMHRLEWGDFHYLITGKPTDDTLTFEGGWQNNRRSGMHEKHRFVENIREELDAPGEWFLDEPAATLYFIPPPGLDLATARIEIARLPHVIEFLAEPPADPASDRRDAVRHLTLQGLTLRHTRRTFMENREPLLRSDWTIYRGGAVFFRGAEDCQLVDLDVDQVGGNAIFVSGYNRRLSFRGCHINRAGANGIAFVGDPKAVRSPLFEYGERQPVERIDRTPGPRSPDYPADCVVEDCLIHETGRVEKQTAPIQIAMSARITVRHCSLYDVPRAGINIGDGCWGGHVIEDCDVFDTVKETGDHGSFNSWGRDRYWLPSMREVDRLVAAHPELPGLDCVETIVLRHNRWRCDHGWDIDLDDGSTNFRIENNLCLAGGLKLREGFRRTVENNVIVANSFHPHVWYQPSGDRFRRNIVSTAYRPIDMPAKWGDEIDHNLFPDAAALQQAQALGLDARSKAGDPRFVDPARGDFRVRDDSPALALGFVNFPMDDFGVRSPRLRRLARSPIGGDSPAR